MRIAHDLPESVGVVVARLEGETRGDLVSIARALHNADQGLRAVGFELLVVPPDVDVRLKRSRRRWWRPNRTKEVQT